MKSTMARLGRFLQMAAWLMVFALVCAMALTGMGMTSQLRAPEVVRYIGGGLIGHVLGTALLLAVLCGLKTLLERFARIRLTGMLMLLWTVLAIVLLLGAGTQQEVDFAYVVEAAEKFAAGDYSPMQNDYLHVYSYQLGTVFPMECVKRLLPGVDIGLLMQAFNAVFSICAAGILMVLGGIVYEQARIRHAAAALYLLFLPMLVYCIHVYGTLPMILFSSAGMLCFVLYIRLGQMRYGMLYAIFIALAYMIKPNSATAMLAMLICAVLHAMESGDLRPLGFAVISVLLAVLLAKLVILQYEWRSGIRLREDVSMLARLVMGLQDGQRAAGWYNSYTERYFDAAISMEQEKAMAMQDLIVRLGEMKGDPVRTMIFFVQKALSQWLEPTYGTLLYGNYCRQTGFMAEASQALFSEESALRAALEVYMKYWQQAMYALAAVGAAENIWKKRGAAALVLPVTVLGGGLYHMIFEAKSQYIFVYAMYLVPLAACGLCIVCDWIGRLLAAAKKD